MTIKFSIAKSSVILDQMVALKVIYILMSRDGVVRGVKHGHGHLFHHLYIVTASCGVV